MAGGLEAVADIVLDSIETENVSYLLAHTRYGWHPYNPCKGNGIAVFMACAL